MIHYPIDKAAYRSSLQGFFKTKTGIQSLIASFLSVFGLKFQFFADIIQYSTYSIIPYRDL